MAEDGIILLTEDMMVDTVKDIFDISQELIIIGLVVVMCFTVWKFGVDSRDIILTVCAGLIGYLQKKTKV